MNKRTAIGAMLLATAVVFAILAFGVHSSANDETKELQMVHIIMRHGIRTPADTYPSDPYINETFHPYGWGQITNAGKLELYQTGIYLRGRYGVFFGPDYHPDRYFVQSTDVDRTKISMQMVNAGLWPPQGAQQWGPLNWQPIPVHSEPLNDDHLLLVRRPCPQYHIELQRLMENNENIREKVKFNEDLFKNLTFLTGKQIGNFDDVQDIFSTLTAEEKFNLTLPEWTLDYYPQEMLEPTIFSYVLNSYNEKLRRFKGGVLLKKLMSDWREIVNGTLNSSKKRAFLYGGHDSTIVNILSAFNVWDPQIPDYGITVLLEFSRDRITRKFGLEIYLRNSTEVEPHLLTIPGCESFCPMETLEKLTKPVIPVNWEEECKTDDENFTVPPPGGP